jgi:hypothetical protein
MKTTMELCKEAEYPLMSFEGVTYVSPELERLVALVRADEREACAKVCEDKSASYSERASHPEKVRDINPEVARVAVQTCGHVAAAIRARGNT